MPHETLSTIKPREYQKQIFNSCKEKNCLVVLPTGIGKTLIALMLTIYTQKKFPATKTLFLAPTRPLAEQHLEYFQKHLPELFAELTLFTGKTPAEKRRKIWETSDIIFSTPQCISNDLKNELYNLEDVTLLIEDECHRCLKNYAYTYISETYKEQAKNPKLLGLTASPGTETEKIKQIAINLGIESIEMRTRDSEDVKEYLQELEYNTIRLEFPDEFKEIDQLIKQLYDRKVQELKNRKLLFGPPTKTNIIKLQQQLMATMNIGGRNFNKLVGVSVAAQAIKISHLIELFETQTLFTTANYIRSLYEDAAAKKSKAVQNIAKSLEFNQASMKINELIAKDIEHPKLLQLISLMEESIKENKKFKTIIFSQFRDTVLKISEELNKIPNLKAKTFVGQAKKANSGLSQKEQQEIMNEFREGKINVICATSIAEEGLDIPEVNSVIFYEPIPSAIRSIQRRGRTARLMKGKSIVLLTLDTLDEIFYYTSMSREKRMYKSIESVKEDLDAGKTLKLRKKREQKTLF